MIIFRTFYCKKTFDFVKKYLFTSYKNQPERIQIESDYSFVLSNRGNQEILDYRVLEIAKSDEITIRLLPNTKSVGGWFKVLSISLDGIDYRSIHISTNKQLIEINKTDDVNHQIIKEYPSN